MECYGGEGYSFKQCFEKSALKRGHLSQDLKKVTMCIFAGRGCHTEVTECKGPRWVCTWHTERMVRMLPWLEWSAHG